MHFIVNSNIVYHLLTIDNILSLQNEQMHTHVHQNKDKNKNKKQTKKIVSNEQDAIWTRASFLTAALMQHRNHLVTCPKIDVFFN